MNGCILRRKGDHRSIIEMDQVHRDCIAALGRRAMEFLVAQDEGRWEAASGPEFLPRLVAGAVILQRIGVSTPDAVVLDDDRAHLAFITCNALGIVAAHLEPEMRKILKNTLKLLAMCCPVEVSIQTLPPLESLPAPLRDHSIFRRQYQAFEEKVDGPRDVMLADALALLRIFQSTRRAQDATALEELLTITEGLRTAFERINKAATSPC
jgi:hypothetical protein